MEIKNGVGSSKKTKERKEKKQRGMGLAAPNGKYYKSKSQNKLKT